MTALFKRKIACLFAIACMICVAGNIVKAQPQSNTWCDFNACPKWDDATKLKGKAIWCEQIEMGMSFEVVSPWGPWKPTAKFRAHQVGFKDIEIEGVWTKKPYIMGRDNSFNGDGSVELSPKFIIFNPGSDVSRHLRAFTVRHFISVKLNRASLEISFEDKNGRDESLGRCIITTEDQLRLNVQPIFKREIKLYKKKVEEIINRNKLDSKNNIL